MSLSKVRKVVGVPSTFGSLPSARPRSNRVMLAVTASRSLGLLTGLPEALAKRGWAVDVVSAADDQPQTGASDDEGNVTKLDLPMVRDPQPLKDLLSLAEWVRVLRRQRPSALLAGTPKAGLLGMVAGKLTGVPVRIYHVRGLRLETVRGPRRCLLAVLERVACMLATDVLAVSSSLADRMAELRLVSRDRVDVLGSGSSNGVDLQRFGKAPEAAISRRSRDLGLPEHIPVIGFVGRITPDKGIADLLWACGILHSRGLEFQLLLIGPADGCNPAVSLVQDAVKRGTPWLNYVGKQRELEAVYPSMTVLCFPSRREGFGNVVIEAAACGVPTVGTMATGTIDAVRAGETGLLVPLGNPLGLADALEKCLLDPASTERMGARAAARAAREFSRPYVQGLVVNYIEARLRPSGLRSWS